MSPARTGLHLAPPPPPDRLAAFPHYSYPTDVEIFRSHAHGRGACWFSNSGKGRFDLAAPDGTCYAAESAVVALLEAWGGMQIVPDYLAAQRDMSRLRIDDPAPVADMTSNAAIRFGVTAEVFATGDYPMTQLWAAALHRAGFAGIRYWARHDLAHTAACLALFGPAGDVCDTALSVVGTEHLPDRRDLLFDLETETGSTVLPVPPI